jgi:sodium/proline symporter
LAIHYFGGINSTTDLLRLTDNEFLNPLHSSDNKPFAWAETVSMLAWGLGYFGQPHISAKFMAIRSNSDLPLARTIVMHWVSVSLLAAVAIGILGCVWPNVHLDGAESENIFLLMAGHMCSKTFIGLILLGALATIMSTVSSQPLVAATSFSRDKYAHHIGKHSSSQELLFVSRLTIFGISILSTIFALNPNNFMLNIVAYA